MIHRNYLLLTATERTFVDEVFRVGTVFNLARDYGVPLDGSDPAERAVEAFATWVIESRGLAAR